MVDDVELAVPDMHHRGVEGSPAQVEDQPVDVVLVALETVGEGGCGRFLQQRRQFQAGGLGGPPGGVGLVQLERGRNGDDRGPDILPELPGDIRLECPQHVRGQFLRGQRQAAVGERPRLVAQPHLALELGGGVRRIGLDAFPGPFADVDPAVAVGVDSRRRRVVLERVLDDAGLRAVQDRDRAVGGTQVDAEVNRRSRHRSSCPVGWVFRCVGRGPARACGRRGRGRVG